MAEGYTLKEDTLKYSIYSIDNEINHENSSSFILNIFEKIGHLIDDYIWQCQSFNLRLVPSTNDTVGHLEGITFYEDNVEDEWFIIYLLLQLSKINGSLIAQVIDGDGDPLLIESADYLPKWINPDSSLNRVYIFQGQIHLIPRKQKKCNEQLKVKEAIELIKTNPNLTRCKEEIQNCIQSRVSNFPKAIQDQKHRARCFVPANVAAILDFQTDLVSHVVRAFYLRDDYDIKACRLMKYFPAKNQVFRNITFTKCLYAQLLSQKFVPHAKLGWDIPPVNSPQFKSFDLGMKLACGFEILVSKAKSTSSEYVNCDDCCDEKWKKFVDSLKAKGYFEGQLITSKGYQKRLLKAYSFYQQSIKNESDNFEDSSQIGERILELVKNLDIDYEKFKKEESHLEPEDDDSWINIDREKFEDILKNQFKNEDIISELSYKIPKAFNSFVNYEKSGLDGAEFPTKSSEEEMKPIDFNPNKIPEALNSILFFKIPQDEKSEDDSSAMSDYDQNNIENELFDSDVEDNYLKLLKVNPNKKESSKELNKKEKMEYIQEMKMYMKAMDKELSKTEIDKSFEKKLRIGKKQLPLATIETDSDDDEPTPINTEFNTLKNILQSFDSQQGLSGPASNILSYMGINLPKNSESSPQNE